jgi:hypothetical protein
MSNIKLRFIFLFVYFMWFRLSRHSYDTKAETSVTVVGNGGWLKKQLLQLPLIPLQLLRLPFKGISPQFYGIDPLTNLKHLLHLLLNNKYSNTIIFINFYYLFKNNAYQLW